MEGPGTAGSSSGSSNKVIVAFSSTPRVACTPFSGLSPVSDIYGVAVRRMVYVWAQPKDYTHWRDLYPDSITWKIIAQTLIEKWYATSEVNVNRILCWHFCLEWASHLCFELETETDADEFYQWIYTDKELLSSFSNDNYSLMLHERREYDQFQPYGLVRQFVEQNRFPICLSEKILQRSPFKWHQVYSNLSTVSSLPHTTGIPGQDNSLFVKCSKRKPTKANRKKTKLMERRYPGPWASLLAVIGLSGSGKRTLVGKLQQMFPYDRYTCPSFQHYYKDQNLSMVYFQDAEHLFLTGIYDLDGSPDPGDLELLLSHANAVLFVIDCLDIESSVPFLRETLRTLSSHRDIPLVVSNHRLIYILSPQSLFLTMQQTYDLAPGSTPGTTSSTTTTTRTASPTGITSTNSDNNNNVAHIIQLISSPSSPFTSPPPSSSSSSPDTNTTSSSATTTTRYKPPHNWVVGSTSVFAPQSLHRIITWLSEWSPKFDYSRVSTLKCSIS
ncbi:hypothetical protein Pelo_16977 [Pelomyxa schiedti]|nr:hypothetical protein Pelo_16977 [Pelomyxa schiedti]